MFGVLLAATFVLWYRVEGTLSIHSILTRRREAFYWLAILVTFALGTAAGDLMAQVLGLGYLVSGIVVAAVIAATATGWRLGLHPVLAFWIIYVLTRPLGASIGDYLSQPTADGGLGLGATLTSLIFLAAIIAIVVYLAVTRADVIRAGSADPATTGATNRDETARGGLLQTVVVVGVLLAAGVAGYAYQARALLHEAAAAPAPAAARRARGQHHWWGGPNRERYAGDSPDLEAGRPLTVPHHHPGHPRPPRPRRPVRGNDPCHRPRDRLGQRGGTAQAARSGCLDRDRRQDRHGAPRAALHPPERWIGEGGARRPAVGAALSGATTGGSYRTPTPPFFAGSPRPSRLDRRPPGAGLSPQGAPAGPPTQ